MGIPKRGNQHLRSLLVHGARAVVRTATLTLFTYGVVEAPEMGWDHPFVVAALVGAAAMVAAFIVVETRSARPTLDLSLLRYPRVVGVQVLPIATCYCYVVLLVLLPLRFTGSSTQLDPRGGEITIT